MIDFRKKIAVGTTIVKTNPIEIYDTLDRASDKNALRPAQLAVLEDWWSNFKEKKDVILKLHTGQGKTLLGLLILQSKLNLNQGPALYLCPTYNLVTQTCEQAAQFGFKYCTIGADKNIPMDFYDSKSILITSVHKLFNGLTRFGLHNRSEKVGSIVLDDSHACIDAIQKAFTIIIKRDEDGFQEILSIFENELEKQGLGTLENIRLKNHDSFLLIPYWAWQEKTNEVARLLASLQENLNVKFAWNLVKDIIKDCQCYISGSHIEISPYTNPIEQFGTFSRANHRVLMSATTNDDSFLIKGLGLDKDAIINPLQYSKETWSGEKMILIPSMFDESLTRARIIEEFARPLKNRKYGVIALVPSFAHSEAWKVFNANVSTTNTIDGDISLLKSGNYDYTNVLVNRYDGIDLADNNCRILIIDSKPYAESLSDRYQELTRIDSEAILVKIAQKIEQGLGRGVRGERDYCVIILTGAELINIIQNKRTRSFFSSQTQTQIQIGLDITDYSKEDVLSDDKMKVLHSLILQCINRDEGWKFFYVDRMNNASIPFKEERILNILQLEREAEIHYKYGECQKAVDTVQKLIDGYIKDNSEKGWYIQEMARYLYSKNKVESNKKQIVAHKLNNYLLKPREGMDLDNISFVNQNRINNIILWVKQFDNHDLLMIQLEETLANLQFGVKADIFERALNELGQILGFVVERPDKQRGEGPDNLWCVRDNDYILFECKNEVKEQREEMNKTEVGQINNSCLWFERIYHSEYIPILIAPTNKVTSAGGFHKAQLGIMRKKQLNSLVNNTRMLFKEFRNLDIHDLLHTEVQTLLDVNHLSIDDLKKIYSEKPIQK
mgnify:CR=1 FL=1